MITIIAKFNVLKGSVDEFKKCAVNVVRDTRKERGNLSYKIYQNRDDPSKFTFIEEWLNDTAIEHTTTQNIFFNFWRILNRLLTVKFKSNNLQKYRLYFAD